MSALGQKQTLQQLGGMSALPPEADMCSATRYVRFVPRADIAPLIRSPYSLCARSARRRDNQLPSYRCLAAASKSTFPNGVARLLAFAKELHIRHDWLVGVVRLPMRNVCFVIGNTNHQTRSARAPITCGPHRTGGLVEQSLQIRHGDLPRLLRQARFPLRSAADCPALFGC